MRLLVVPRLLFAVVVVFSIWYGARQRHRDAHGMIIVDAVPFRIEACRKLLVTGEDSIGVDLLDAHGTVLRLVRDQRGQQLWLYTKGSDVAIPIDRRDCSQWDIAFLSKAGAPFSPDGGDVSITCAAGGRKIDGHVFFEHCPP
jgi:hypothetical protein